MCSFIRSPYIEGHYQSQAATEKLVKTTIKVVFSDSKRIKFEDKKVDADLADIDLRNHLFLRLVAKEKRFTHVDFSYSIFDTCYMRRCEFDSCNFTGCRFTATNLHGSNFSGCQFDYSIFERTIIDDQLLVTGCPSTENLTLRFARTLRMNYQQLGDWRLVNKAIKVELQATETHLHKAWRSKESYYRHKFIGLNRLKMWIEWVGFRILDWVWGNGESAPKLLRAVVAFFLLMFFIGLVLGDRQKVGLVSALFRTPEVFFGAITPANYPVWYLTAIVVARLVAFGFFMSILVKRLSRR